jgi:hypothetical protein
MEILDTEQEKILKKKVSFAGEIPSPKSSLREKAPLS